MKFWYRKLPERDKADMMLTLDSGDTIVLATQELSPQTLIQFANDVEAASGLGIVENFELLV
jgi:argininosuccinate synthase